MKKTSTHASRPARPLPGAVAPLLFFLLAWLWATWWMGDTLRTAYERSFFAPSATLMTWLWEQSFGSLWILGRAALTLYRMPVVGGLAVALMLTAGSWLFGYCLRLRPHWRWAQYIPAGAWMLWTAIEGLNLFYEAEPGRILGIPLLAVVVCAVDAFIIWTFKSRRRHHQAAAADAPKAAGRWTDLLPLAVIVLCIAIPSLTLQLRHPYQRPLTRMQVQMLDEDWNGMAATAQAHATLSYRPLAAYYAIALVRNGRLTSDLFKIRLDYDSLYVKNRQGQGDNGSNYYIIDCNYHAGLFRAATHKAMEQLTMDGPSLFTLKHLTRLALLDGEWALARKYLHIIDQAPFEHAFVEHYTPMVGNADAVAADPEFALLRQNEPIDDFFESQLEKPAFMGYAATLIKGRSQQALMMSIMANLYSKRMPDFLMRCEPLVGTTPPVSIAEGLVTQAPKNPAVLKAFPNLQMDVQRYTAFIRNLGDAIKDRPAHARELFDQYAGYYPYYYFFGNLKATRQSNEKTQASSNAGVN